MVDFPDRLKGGGAGPRTIAEIIEKAASAAAPQNKSTQPSGWPVICPSALDGKTIPERRWCLPGWFPDGCVSLLSGDGGTGKSLLAMQLATCASTGTPFFGIEMAPRKVLYLSCEDDLDELHRRQADINAALGIDWPDLDGQLFWRPVVGEETTLMGPDRSGRRLVTTALYDNLRRYCRENGVQLIIIDTLADTFGGLEIDRQQVTRFVRSLQAIARECDGACVLVGHPSVAGIRDNTGISGNTAWRNAVRSVVQMRRPNEEEASGPSARDLRILERLKGNYAPSDTPLMMRYFDGAFMLDGNSDQSAVSFDIFATEVKVEAALKAALKAGRHPSPAKNSENYVVAMLMHYPETKGLTRKHIEGTVERMLTAGRLRIARLGRVSRQSQVLVPMHHPPLPDERDPSTGEAYGGAS